MKMSSIKKVSRLVFVVVTILACTNIVSAQALPPVPNDTTIKPKIIQEPEITVRNLILEKNTYNAGETIKGTFDLQNTRVEAIGDVYYEIRLVGDYQKNTLADKLYDLKKVGPYYFKGGETKSLSFEYTLLKNVGGDLGIQIRSKLGAGFTLGWTDYKIKVLGDNGFLDITTAYVLSGKDKFNLQAGPTITASSTISLNVSFKNNTLASMTIAPKVVIYNRAVTSEIKANTLLEKVSLTKGEEKNIKYDLPVVGLKPGVYVGNLYLNDDKGVSRSAPLEFRYIVGGDIATILSVSVDKTMVKTGEEILATVKYTGNTFDIQKPASTVEAVYDLSLKFTNEDGKIIGEQNTSFDFNSGLQKEIKVQTTGSAETLSVEAKVTKNGQVIAEYKSVFPEEKKEGLSSDLWAWLALVVGLIVLVTMMVIKKKSSKQIVIAIFVILISLTFTQNALAWTEVDNVIGDYNIDVYISSISGVQLKDSSGVARTSFSPGAQFNITGTTVAVSCNNLNQVVRLYTALPNEGAWTLRNTIFGNTWGGNENSGVSHQYSDFSVGPFNAPTTPGSYRIYLLAHVCQAYDVNNIRSECGYRSGYIDYTVVAPPPENFTLACPSLGLGENYLINGDFSTAYNQTSTGWRNSSGGDVDGSKISISSAYYTGTGNYHLVGCYGTQEGTYSEICSGSMCCPSSYTIQQTKSIPAQFKNGNYDVYAGCNFWTTTDRPDMKLEVLNSSNSVLSTFSRTDINSQTTGVSANSIYGFSGSVRWSKVTMGGSFSTTTADKFKFSLTLKKDNDPIASNVDTDIDDCFVHFVPKTCSSPCEPPNSCNTVCTSGVCSPGGPFNGSSATASFSSATPSCSGVTLSWPLVSGADGYYLYRGINSTSLSPINENNLISSSTVQITDSVSSGTYVYGIAAHFTGQTGVGTLTNQATTSSVTVSACGTASCGTNARNYLNSQTQAPSDWSLLGSYCATGNPQSTPPYPNQSSTQYWTCLSQSGSLTCSASRLESIACSISQTRGGVVYPSPVFVNRSVTFGVDSAIVAIYPTSTYNYNWYETFASQPRILMGSGASLNTIPFTTVGPKNVDLEVKNGAGEIVATCSTTTSVILGDSTINEE